jgi:hypothetical protein
MPKFAVKARIRMSNWFAPLDLSDLLIMPGSFSRGCSQKIMAWMLMSTWRIVDS